MQVAYDTGMEFLNQKSATRSEPEEAESPRRKRRRIKLGELVDANGGVTRVADRSGTPKSHLSALLNASRGLGDKLAEKLEQLYDKPRGWVDTDPGYVDEDETPTAKGLPPGKRSGSMLGLSKQQPRMDVVMAFKVLGESLAALDDIGRQQVQPLFEALIKHPENASQYGNRYTSTVAAAKDNASPPISGSNENLESGKGGRENRNLLGDS
jgi:hypothetical protein